MCDAGAYGHSPGCEIVMGLSVRNTKTWEEPYRGHRREGCPRAATKEADRKPFVKEVF